MELLKRCHKFHLHHCGVFDRYAELYTVLNPYSIDVGAGSDYKLMRKIYPDTPTSLIINPADIEGRSREEIDKHISNMVENAAPFSLISFLSTADFKADISDENIRDLATVHTRI